MKLKLTFYLKDKFIKIKLLNKTNILPNNLYLLYDKEKGQNEIVPILKFNYIFLIFVYITIIKIGLKDIVKQ